MLKYKNIWTLFLWIYIGNCHQTIAQSYETDYQELYQKCTHTRLDSAHRLIVTFLRKHKIIQTPDKFYIFCSTFKEKCQQNQNKELLRRAKIIEIIDKLKYDKATSTIADKTFGNLYEQCLEQQDHSAALSCLLEWGLFQGHCNRNLKAIKVLFFAEKFAEKHNLLNDIAFQTISRIIGYYLWEFDIPTLSIQYFKKSLQTKFSMRVDSLIILNGIGINYQKLNDFPQSNHYFEQARAFAQHVNNPIFEVVIKGNIAVNLFKTGYLAQAYQYAQQDKDMSLQNGIWENAIGAMYWLIQIELKQNNLTHAKVLLDSLDGIVSKVEDKRFLAQRRQKEATYLYYQALKDAKKSLLAYQEFVHYDSLFQEYANKNKISELKLTAEVQLYVQEMEQKEQEKKTKALLFNLLLSGLFVILFVSVWYFYQKNKQAKKNKNENERLNQENKVLKQQLFIQLNAINQQNTELQANLTFEITPKENEAFEFIPENNPIKQADIQFLRNFNLNQKEHWQTFKQSFLQVFPSFEQNLASRVGEVSNAELRLLMLHKLGLNNQEISKTLLISPESVRTGKYRLYKKFSVSSNEELDALL